MPDSPNDDLWGKWKGCHNRPGRYRAIIGARRNAPCYIVEKRSLFALNFKNNISGAIAGSESPAKYTVMFKANGIFNGVLAMDICCTSAVSKIIKSCFPVKVIEDSPERPHVREPE